MAGDFKTSYSQIQDINISNIKNKKQKSEIGRFRMLIEKTNSINKKQKYLKENTRKKCNYFGGDNYKTIHNGFLTFLAKQKQQQ